MNIMYQLLSFHFILLHKSSWIFLNSKSLFIKKKYGYLITESIFNEERNSTG